MASYEHNEERHRFSGPRGSEIARVSIDEALANNWLDVWYQPKIDLRRKCLAGAEVLVRVHHPQAGLLWPEDFLTALDEESLLKLSEYSLVTSLRHWTVFAEAGFGLRLSINMPASLLPRIPVNSLVAAHRPRSDKWPGLILELTEDQIVRDLPLIRQIAKEFKSSAIALAIDEFGAGYSSFSSLRDLPFSELKLHALFVKNCAADVTNAAICQTAIDLAHRFGSVVVAEGIDTIADLQALIVMGCDLGQGMLLAPPLPKERFLDALRQHSNKPRTTDHGSQKGNERVA
jgi:EAL domain-containing protein (putative c-di-GMP-specific phosphodiesterase class I)